MKTISRIVLTALLALSLAACGDDDDDGGNADAAVITPDANVPDAGPPVKPTPGAQIDRFGRPAINTALQQTFTADDVRNAAEDAYNGDGAKAGWQAAYTANFRGSLGVLDALDTVCGNQLAADLAAPRYAAVAGLLADDQLYIKSDSATCSTYLAVEANAVGIVPNTDCGGRKLNYDVIDETYSVVAIGGLSGVDDNVTFTSATSATFPYLGAPTN